MKTQQKNGIWKWHLFMLLFVLPCFIGCSDDDNGEVTATVYDPNQPVTITGFTPDSAAGGAQFVVYGTNFGTDLEQIKVTINDKEAVLISSNGACLYCFVPQKAGDGVIKVSVGKEGNVQEAVSGKEFKYVPALVLKTLTGHVDEDGNSSIKDGDFDKAQFQAPYWLEVDDEDNLYLIEDQQGLRKIDLKNEKVTTLWRSGNGIDHARCIAFNSDHSQLYIFNDQDASEAGIAVAVADRTPSIAGAEEFSSFSTLVSMKSCCGGDVHPVTNQIYFNQWNGGDYFEWNFETKEKTQIFRLDNQFNSTLIFAPSGNFGYIVSMSHHCIYRVNYDRENQRLMTPYILCGYKGQSGYTDGPGTKARFYEPQQGCFDEDDNFYVCDQANNLIRKVEPNGQVTTFAGRYQDWGLSDGDLRKEARFDRPHGIAYNKNTGDFYIADKNNKRIRIITKE